MKKTIKNTFLILIGSLIGNLSIANAPQIENVYQSNFPIILENKSHLPKNQLLNYNGLTYLPLREFATITNNNIEFSNSTIYINSNNTSKENEIPNDKYNKSPNKSKQTITNIPEDKYIENSNTNFSSTQTQKNNETTSSNNENIISNEKIVYTTNSGTKYHLSNCRFLNKSKIEISLSEAIQKGFSACNTCKP